MSCYKHGDTVGGKPSKEYERWSAMKQRCYDPSCPNYKRYGARGIKVCDRWLASYSNFIADMGRRPSSRHSLDRINNDGHYEPGNCRWSTKSEQGRNTRTNRNLTCDGRTMTVVEWAEEIGVSYDFLYHRIEKGWSHERAIKQPKDKKYVK